MGKTLQGRFRPKNPEKYRGDYQNILYRSSWERMFMNYCDDNEAIKKWQSEEKCIWYYDPIQKKNRRYFPDFIIEYERKDGITIQEMVEIKPYRQVIGPPENPKRRTKAWAQQCMTYVVNNAKWKAARKYCEDKGMNFRIITEKELKITL